MIPNELGLFPLEFRQNLELASSQQEMTTVKGFTEAVRSQMVDLELMYSGYSGKS